VRLQRTRVLANPADSERDLTDVSRFVGELSEAYPGHAPRLEQVGTRLRSELQPGDRQLVPSHGDYHPKNVFVAREWVTVIDFDTFGLREAAFDVGYAIGQLVIMSVFRTGDLASGVEAASAFWRRYRKSDLAPWRRVTVHIARTFLQSLHYELCVLKNGRVELLTLWPDLIDHWLAGDDSDVFHSLIRGR
jgi:aminoglycoside phosphotransferase (APT) family kinase protein